jgi:hypothetical protein
MHLFDLTLTNQEQILPLEQRAIFSSLTAALLGERWTADGQRGFYQPTEVLRPQSGTEGDWPSSANKYHPFYFLLPGIVNSYFLTRSLTRSFVSPRSHSCASQCSLGRLYINGRLKMESVVDI